MATLTITTQSSDQPDVLRFKASKLLSANKAVGFYNSEDVGDNDVVRSMFDVPGVSGVMLVNQLCIVRKTSDANWDVITPEIEKIIQSGWSD